MAAVLPRAAPHDLLVGAHSLTELPVGALVGTSSTRRRVQLVALRPDLRFTELRDNVQTRLAKIARGEARAICRATSLSPRLLEYATTTT